MGKINTCCFTGHRPDRLYLYNSEEDVFSGIVSAVNSAVEDGYTDFLCGGCVGGDFLFAEAVIIARSEQPDKNIKLHMCLPCRNQAELWNREDRIKYSNLLDASDSIVCLNENYTDGCMKERNRYMVDRSSLLIAAFNGSQGGTAYTVKYAKSLGLRIVNLLETPVEESNQLSFL